MTDQRELPFGSEFSPSQIDLARLLTLASMHEGDPRALQTAIQAEFFARHGGGSADNQRKLAMNCRLGMKAYGLIDEEARLTDLGQELVGLAQDPVALHARLARHVLLHLNGMAMIQCIRDLQAAGDKLDLTTLREQLALRGIQFPRGGKHPSMMRLWLERAGVFVGGRWQLDEARLRSILGTDPADFDRLAGLTPEQRAFLATLANTGTTVPQPANDIARLAAVTHGVKFPEKSLPKLVLDALVEAGYLKTTKTTAGRGAKPFMVEPTDQLIADIVLPWLGQIQGQTDSKLIELLRRPLSDILDALTANDRYIGGLALEALAFKLMRLLGLDYVATRLRAQSTGGAEVDLVFESKRLVFSRWQVQCKNTARVALDDVAKEVGLTHLLKSNVILMVTTGDIGTQARRYANRVMADSNLCIVMLDGADLGRIRERPVSIVDALEREASHAMTLKKLDMT